jgi:hypothetical protein
MEWYTSSFYSFMSAREKVGTWLQETCTSVISLDVTSLLANCREGMETTIMWTGSTVETGLQLIVSLSI